MSSLPEETDQHRAIHVNHISPSWVEYIDRELGRAKQVNGGFLELTVQWANGRTGIMKLLHSLTPSQWRRDMEEAV